MPGFVKENSKVIKAPVGPGRGVVARRGSMLAYTGEVSFRPVAGPGGGSPFGAGGMGGALGGLAGMAGRAMSGESQPLMFTDGEGEVLYGHEGLHVEVVVLQGDMMQIEASRILCHDESLMPTIRMLGQGGGLRGAVGAVASGQGLATSIFQGFGEIAVLSHGTPFEIPVQGQPVRVDPQSYVSARGHVQVELKSSAGFRDLTGRGAGEAFQLEITGQGSVWIQPSEEKL